MGGSLFLFCLFFKPRGLLSGLWIVQLEIHSYLMDHLSFVWRCGMDRNSANSTAPIHSLLGVEESTRKWEIKMILIFGRFDR